MGDLTVPRDGIGSQSSQRMMMTNEVIRSMGDEHLPVAAGLPVCDDIGPEEGQERTRNERALEEADMTALDGGGSRSARRKPPTRGR